MVLRNLKDIGRQVCKEAFLQQDWTQEAQKRCSKEQGRVNDLHLHCGNGALLVQENPLAFSTPMV